ncbi:MAG TPA: aerobic carbon-monoxide dehydrogenase large subunit [Actinomycetota bacterium]|nr:aerobic carbon-monoxide dehydrogenase large subunit [Actinomycetota bacterium]
MAAEPARPSPPAHESAHEPVHESAQRGAIGANLPRREDDRFIRGQGTFVADVALPGMAHMAILRSPMARAKIRSINVAPAFSLPGVIVVVTGELLATRNLAWMPTPSGDVQPVLAVGEVCYQGQEVACVIAEDPYTAHDALELLEVDYEPLPGLIDPTQALAPDAPRVRQDKPDNVCYSWEAGDAEATDRAFAGAARVISLDTYYPRCHPAPLECCGCLADVHAVEGSARIYLTSQAPHAHRTILAGLVGLPEHQVRIISPDIGGAFGNKMPLYPGYVAAVAASFLLDRPVRWIEDRTGNLLSTGFARDFRMHGELALDRSGRILGLRVTLLSDHGAFYADAQPAKFRAGLFHIVTGSYDIPAAHVAAQGVYTNKAPGGVAYRCSFRVTEAAFLIERLMTTAASDLGVDPAEMRRRNFILPEQFPYRTATGFSYDSGNYEAALDLALEKAGYAELRREQAEGRKKGRLMGIGISSFTEVAGAGPSRDYDLMGIKMFDSAELIVAPTGKAILKLGVQSQGQGHETTFAQIVAHELGIPPDDVAVYHGDTNNTPYGLGTFGSRSTPTGGAATAVACRQLIDKARRIAAHLLEVEADDVVWQPGRFSLRGLPEREVTFQEVAAAAYMNPPEGLEPGLDTVSYYDPPQLTFPYGTYIVAVEVNAETGEWKVLKMVAVDDCGVRINPMIVEGQIMGGLAEGYAIASMQVIDFDEHGVSAGSTFEDYLVPTAWETPRFELHELVTPCPHHPLGTKGVGESPTVGSPAAFVNAVVDALAPLGVRNIDMPLTSDKVWEAIQGGRD